MLELQQAENITNVIKNSWWMLDYTEFCDRLKLDPNNSQEKWTKFQNLGQAMANVGPDFFRKVINSNQDLSA